MLYAHLMIGANQAALEQRPDAFHAVRVNITAHPFLGTVIDTFVFSVLVLDSGITRILVGHDPLRFVGNHLFDKSVKDFLGRLLATLSLQMNMATAFDSAKHHSLVSDISAANMTTLAANIGL